MWVCEDVKMWRWADVKMSRCEDEKMWRWEDVKMRRCEDKKMWRGADVKMSRCEDEQMSRWADVKMSRCEECEDEQMWRWEGVREGVEMRRCEDEKVWRWEDEIQTPTIGRTLRSDALHESRTTYLDKAVRNVSKELSEAWLEKRKGAARNQRWSERPRSLDLIFCRLDFPLHPNRPPLMPCHSCLAIVEQQQQLLLYSRLARSNIHASKAGLAAVQTNMHQTMPSEIPDLQNICQMNRRMKCQATVPKKWLIECQDIRHIEFEQFCQSECWIECLNLPKAPWLNLWMKTSKHN